MTIRTILVADDSATDRTMLRELLTSKGFRVLQAENGEQAIAMTRGEFPDLVLMAVVMPGTNGFQATRTLARDPATRHIPIIMCSSKNQETDRVWGMRQGAHAYFAKPIDTAALLDTIAALNNRAVA